MINLLPPYWQEKLREEETVKIAAIIGVIVAFALAAFILMLALAWVSCYYQLKSGQIIISEKEQEIKIFNVEAVEKQIASNNNLISKISDFYAKQTKITEVFLKVADLLPAGVVLRRFGYTPQGFILEGYSSDRDSLVLFRKNLEQRPDFKKIFFPAESWFNALDVEFSVSFEYAKP